MRILIIRNAYFYDYGGGERFPVNLAQELQQLGHSPVVVSRSPKLLRYAAAEGVAAKKGWWWSRQNWSGLRVALVPLYLLWQVVLTLWYVQLILRVRPQVVHPQSKDDFVAATLAGRLLGKRVVWTDHADLKYVFANHRVWYKNPVGKLVYACSRLAACITLVSHSEAELVAEQLGKPLPPRFTVVHNGVREMTVEAQRPEAADLGKFVYCATSRLVTAKGIAELIAAFKALHAKYPETLLWIVGDGPEAAEFKAQADGNADIRFIGHSDKALTYVAGCDVFVHPSYHEGFSLSLVEAAMLARPIVACNVGGNPEIIHDNETGLLILPQDSDALLAAIQELYANRPLAGKLGEQARRLYEKEFRFEKIVAEKFIPIYEAK